jgi:tetratricopeptide (TPR) repeat protein
MGLRSLCLAASLVLASVAIAGPVRAQAEPQAASPATPASGAEADPAPPALPARPERLLEAWATPAPSVGARLSRTQHVLSSYGLERLEPAARALVLDPDQERPLEAAEAASVLAPTLPLAAADLATARLASGDLLGAGRAWLQAMANLFRHLEASWWLEVTALEASVLALFLGGALYLCVAGLAVLRRASHDLGDLLLRGSPLEADPAPGFARAALLATLLLLPAMLGEGVVGLLAGLFFLLVVYGGRAQRTAAVLATLGVVCALHPVADRSVRSFAAITADPVAPAALAVQGGSDSWLDRLRVARAAPSSPLALESLALEARREARLDEAQVVYSRLMPEVRQPRIRNNAANVHLLRGEIDEAIDLYRSAASGSDSATVFFNLAQAYGLGIRLDDAEDALSRAQQVDPERVDQLLSWRDGGGPQVADLLVPVAEVRQALARSAQGPLPAHPLRTALAPGQIGESQPFAFIALALLAAAGFGVARSFGASGACGRCGRRICPRCDPKGHGDGLCETCTRLYRRPETTDPTLRLERLSALRGRQQLLERLRLVASVLVPASAGVFGDQPLRGLAASFCFASALACFLARAGAVPDPLAVGSAGPALFTVLASVFFLAYAVVLSGSLSRPGAA